MSEIKEIYKTISEFTQNQATWMEEFREQNDRIQESHLNMVNEEIQGVKQILEKFVDSKAKTDQDQDDRIQKIEKDQFKIKFIYTSISLFVGGVLSVLIETIASYLKIKI